MFRVLLDRLNEVQPLVCLVFPRVEIIQVEDNFVNLPVGELLEQILVLVLRLARATLVPAPPLLGLVVLVHKVIFVAEIILIDVDIAEGSSDSLVPRSFEVGNEGLEGVCEWLAMRFGVHAILHSPSCTP